MEQPSLIGKSVLRVDGYEKVTGRATFNTEVMLGAPGVLHAELLQSPYSHARIVSIDTSRAEKLPGVEVVLTGRDVPEVLVGTALADRYLLPRDRVRFAGETVAVVAAKTSEIATEALDLIRVEYEELPGVYDPEEAMKPDCPVVIHHELAKYKRPVYRYLGNDLPGPNVNTHSKVRKGDVERGFEEADLIVENRFRTPQISHCIIEPFNCTAMIDSNGTLTVWTPTHKIFSFVQADLCKLFELPPSKVRVISNFIGGGFGANSNIHYYAALLALKTRKPVRLECNRDQCFTIGPHRAAAVIYVKDGIMKDGTLVAREIKAIYNTGAYCDITPVVIKNGAFVNNQYRIPNFKLDAYGVYTNEVPSGPFRGFGNFQPAFAIEQQMDIIAEKLGMSPLQIRQKNVIKEGEENIMGETTHSVGAAECLEKVSDWIMLGERVESKHRNIKIGKGIALANKYTRVDTTSGGFVKVHRDGLIEVRTGMDVLGQGSLTAMSQIAAEAFKVPLAKVKIVWGDTSLVPYDEGSVSSRTTFFVGNAILLAADDAKRQMFKIAAPILKAKEDQLETANGKIYAKGAPEKSIPISELFFTKGVGAQGNAALLPEGGELIGRSTFVVRDATDMDPETGHGKRLSASYCYIAEGAEVAVDTETGEVKVQRFCSASDVGKAINPKLCECQMDGGAVQGIGSALYEQIVIEKGRVLNANMHDYRIPTMMELPRQKDFESIVVETYHKEGPYGAKGCGEATTNAAGPALANAIYDAVGVRIMELPITREKVLAAIKRRV